MRHQRLSLPDSACRILPEREIARLSAAFPRCPAVIGHALKDDPLLSLEILADAASRMRPEHVECRQSTNANGAPFAFAQGQDPARVIREIAGSGRWVMLRFAEQLPEYAGLLHRLLDELTPLTAAYGPPLQPRAFIFISSPGTLTPFHFDPEFNVLFQIAGQKRFATYPVSDPWLMAADQERFHQDGDNLLPWQDDYAADATVHALAPGDALFVPYKSPHWVEVGEEPSISLSLTWSSRQTLELEAAWQAYGWLRRHRLPSAPPPHFPGRAPVKAGLRRALQRLGQG